MASTLGIITMAAYLAADPKPFLNESDPKKSVTRFRVLHNPFGKDKNGNQLPPVGIDFVCFGAQAGIAAQYLKKGSCPTVVANIKSVALAKDKDGNFVKTKNGDFIITVECDVIQLHLGARSGDAASNGSSNGEAANGGTVAAETGALANAPF